MAENSFQDLILKSNAELSKLSRLAAGFSNRLDAATQSQEKEYLSKLISTLDETPSQFLGLENQGDQGIPKLYSALETLLQADTKLREEYQIGARFNVVHTQLESILKIAADEMTTSQNAMEKNAAATAEAASNQSTVYVFLFNAQGAVLKTWQKQLLPGALVEHSVNRPIYESKEQVENVIRAKPNKPKLAYLEIAVNKDDIMQMATGSAMKDQHGYPLLRLRQGALKVENIRNFVHNDKAYQVFDGSLVSSDDYCRIEDHQ